MIKCRRNSSDELSTGIQKLSGFSTKNGYVYSILYTDNLRMFSEKKTIVEQSSSRTGKDYKFGVLSNRLRGRISTGLFGI